ncbi:MAG: hypothetical protein A2826_01300 [Candidatus Doudnabacteria bacterium RIFCSPHIGHO2_01_FULL_43_23]|uniref:Small-conductance mechanosensitive ion channel n=1 Tax=Candidatus Doudnabacteria bacterium RIFCSPHIGHO2_01_FULL_43_23 TaxID=1817822 RepID=A0A1F5NTP5_9BACT|nr:MAG: hypothetical protein A2826_01300 [Candidatus Doudnabacteria bacterium RIFCSPHIGHO2_01_FULL_43_23]
MGNESVGSTVQGSLSGLYEQVISFLPAFVAALLVLIFGWALAILLGKLVRKVLELIKIDDLADRLGLATLGERMGKKLSIAGFGEWLIKWFFLIGIFVAATDILGLNQVGAFLYLEVLPYFANVIVAAAILVIGTVAANFLHGIILHSLNASRLGNAEAVSSLTRWAVLIFAFLAALSQLGVATSFIQDLFRAVVALLAIAGGIAFGLGGKEHAKAFLDHLSKDFRK